MSDTLLRQWEMLRAIPRFPRKVDAGTLMARLEAAGYPIALRTLQRDLKLLSSIFPLQSDTRSTPYGWSWSADAPAFDLPAMDGPTALSVRMIEQFIPTLLPPSIHELLAPQFARARAVMEANPNNPLGHWIDCVRAVPREMPLLAPKVNGEAARVIYQALLDGRRIQMTYSPRSSEGEGDSDYEVNPLGLVARANLIYLVATLWNDDDVRHLALHRVKTAVMTEIAATRPTNFDLDRYIEQGAFQYPVGPIIELQVKFDRSAASHLYETPLSDDQVIDDTDAEHVIVTASVRNTAQLTWWLLGFGELAEVLKPETLRQSMERFHRTAAQQYIRGFRPE
jgi:predicted DNA-binding transcriptional regulator YafY